ncbi:MAG: hypothetical protein K2X48_00420 [Chitinophagaceae bacterium]|nr:hypothetical protein [Chitinophagaceae bacterium]
MKKRMYLLIASLLLAGGCTSSKITTSWKAENKLIEKYNRILILGLIHDKDRGLQERMENHLAGDLQLLGYNTVTSLKEYGPKAFNGMNEQEALAKLKSSGVDAVLTIVLLDKQKERYYVPGRMYYSPYGPYYNRFWGYRGILYERIYEPGYYVTDTKYFWESNLYDMKTQELVYSVQTESFDPVNTESQAHEYGKMIVKDMVKQQVVK